MNMGQQMTAGFIGKMAAAAQDTLLINHRARRGVNHRGLMIGLYVYVEANHQPSMVHASPRPMIYKQRVLSRSGHLSNEACGHLLTHVHSSKLKHVHLAHLSSE